MRSAEFAGERWRCVGLYYTPNTQQRAGGALGPSSTQNRLPLPKWQTNRATMPRRRLSLPLSMWLALMPKLNELTKLPIARTRPRQDVVKKSTPYSSMVPFGGARPRRVKFESTYCADAQNIEFQPPAERDRVSRVAERFSEGRLYPNVCPVHPIWPRF